MLRATPLGQRTWVSGQGSVLLPPSLEKKIYIPAPPLLLANSANGNSMPVGFQVQILEGIQNSISLVPKSV